MAAGTGAALADETLKFGAIYHPAQVQVLPVGDVEGHVVGTFKYAGTATFPDGSTAACSYVGTLEYTKGVGPHRTIGSCTWEDGTVLWFRADGVTTLSGGKSIFQGTATVLGGKGKYDGAKGDGSYVGFRPGALGQSDLVDDLTLNIKG